MNIDWWYVRLYLAIKGLSARDTSMIWLLQNERTQLLIQQPNFRRNN